MSSHESCEVIQVVPTCLTFVCCPFLEYEVQAKQPLQSLSAHGILSRVNLGASFSCRSSTAPLPLCSGFLLIPTLALSASSSDCYTPLTLPLAVRTLLVLLTVTSLYHLLRYIYDLLMQHVPLLPLTSFNS